MALVGNRGDVYIQDNRAFAVDGSPLPITEGKIIELDQRPVWPKDLEPLPADRVFQSVLQSAGARPWDRDPIDQRIVRQVRDGEGRIIHSQDQVGGYPEVQPVHRTLTIPDQDIDTWLARFTPAGY